MKRRLKPSKEKNKLRIGKAEKELSNLLMAIRSVGGEHPVAFHGRVGISTIAHTKGEAVIVSPFFVPSPEIFNMCFFYILHSSVKDKYYTGATCDTLKSRLDKHNMHHKGYTGQTNDWVIAYFEEYESKIEAFQREKQVKNWKSRKRIIKLINGD